MVGLAKLCGYTNPQKHLLQLIKETTGQCSLSSMLKRTHPAMGLLLVLTNHQTIANCIFDV
jgi:hypothetical protein